MNVFIFQTLDKVIFTLGSERRKERRKREGRKRKRGRKKEKGG